MDRSHAPSSSRRLSTSLSSPWHPGEREAQARVGADARMAEIGPRVIRDAMPDQHREFFAGLPFVVVGADDADGEVQATLLEGPTGFVRSPDPRMLTIAALPRPGDPLSGPALEVGASIGLLGIEWQTRRRNRANGVVVDAGERGFIVAVTQSFGNCPQYIRRREPDRTAAAWTAPGSAAAASMATSPWPAARALIRSAESFFVASRAAGPSRTAAEPVGRGAMPTRHDVSHRGGPAGFLVLSADGSTLTWPDYRGNFFFNTLGNLVADPSAAIVVPDPATGDLLHLGGRCTIEWDGADVRRTPGAERLVRMTVERIGWRPGALQSRWRALD